MNTWIKGTIILTIAAFITRFLGVIQRVPLQRILGDHGMATYGIAYNIYSILLLIATVGIPSALSKQMAEYHSAGMVHEANATFRAAREFSIVAGVASFLFLYWIAPYYAVHIAHDPEAILAIRAISPALLVFPLIAIMRGYFHGLQSMAPTGISQITEQILRVGAALVLPLLLFQAGYSHEAAVAGASFGAVAGSVGAMAVMLYYYFRTKNQQEFDFVHPNSVEKRTERARLSQLLMSAIPISFASMAIPFIYFVDSSTVIFLLQSQVGYEAAKNLLGMLTGRAQALAAIPPILAIAISSAVLPAVASAYARKDQTEVDRTVSLALRLTLITGTPLALFLTAAALPVNGFLFSDTNGSLMISALCFTSVFQIVMMTTMAILQGLGKAYLSMWYVLGGIMAKLSLNFILIPFLGIYGAIAATACAFVVILFLHFRSIAHMIVLEVMGERWKGFLMAGLSMGSITWLIYKGLSLMIPSALPQFLYYGILCTAAGLVGFPVYLWVLFWKKGLLRQDADDLPTRFRPFVTRMMKKDTA